MTVFRAARLAAALLSALVPAALAHPVADAPLLQKGGGQNHLEVIAWTLGAAGAAMLVLAIGYVYRRAVGKDKPPPVPLLEPGQKIAGED